jgi:PEGA domain-containing protein/PDZ domain-containing protein
MTRVYKLSVLPRNLSPFNCGQGKVSAAALACLLALSLIVLSTVWAQTSRKPLSKQEVIELLTTDLPSSQVEAAARQFGISFQVTAAVEGELRDAGATDALMKTLKELAPKTEVKSEAEAAASPPAAAPPVLLIQSNPGGAQVFIDDEPLATTSPEGRLKLTRLAPGSHTVRLALAGYQDFEQQVSLADGQTASVQANFQPAKPAEPAAAASSGAHGTLAFVYRKAPEGQEGVLVLAVVPGGPAEQIGLLPGYLVTSIAGHELAALPDVANALSGHPPGDQVEVIYNNGAATLKRRAVLAAPNTLAKLPHFRVVHDHGPPTPNYCEGEMLIVGKTILYEGRDATSPSGPSSAVHHFDIQTSHIVEVRKNSVYMSAQGAFHIRTKKGLNLNFILVGPAGKYLPPEPVLSAIAQSMATP